MFTHALSTALRNFRHSPFITTSNILSLSFGLACFILGYAVLAQWNASDRHFANSDRIYAITQKVEPRGSSRSAASTSSTYHLAKYLRADFPQLEAVARVANWSEIPATAGDMTLSLTLAGADAQFLEIFDLPFAAGERSKALRNPGSLILTSHAAQRLFGSANPIGQRVRLNGQLDVTVTGISDPPQPSHIGPNGVIHYEMLASWDVVDALIAATQPAVSGATPEIWLASCCTTYALLPKDGTLTPRDFRNRLQTFAKRHVPQEQLAIADVNFDAISSGAIETSELQNILLQNSGLSISVKTVVIAFVMLVLVVACLNYANLSTAQTLARSSELGVRKILGASWRQLALQNAFEASLLVTLSCLIAIAMVAVALPILHAWSGMEISFEFFSTIEFIVVVFTVTYLMAFVISLYPSLVAAKIRPRAVLRGKKSGITKIGLKFLVGMQFVAGCFLLITVLVISKQNHELRSAGLGNGSDQIVVAGNLHAAHLDLNTLRTELLNHPEIKAVSSTEITPWGNEVIRGSISRSANIGSKQLILFGDTVGDNFFSTMQIKLLAGREFEATDANIAALDRTASSALIPKIVIDQSLCQQLEFTSPAAAVGQILYLPNAFGKPPQPIRIIGVVENKPLHFVGKGSTANAYFFSMQASHPLVRVSGANIANGIAAIDEVWHKLSPTVPPQHRFMDELFDANFAVFGRISRIFSVLTTLALVIATMGLVGMAMHVINAKTHEIGVRKTLGASAARILTMLLREFGMPVVIANIVAWPLAAIAAKAYLNVFIYQVPLTIVPFAAGLLFTLVLAWLAVAINVVRAARLSPATVLRSE